MSLSKIVKKDRVVINDGKYTIPISNTNKSAEEKTADIADLSELSELPDSADSLASSDSDTEYAESEKNGADYTEYTGSDMQDIPPVPERPDIKSVQNQGGMYHRNNHNNHGANHREPVRSEQGKIETTELIAEEIVAQAQKTADIIISHTLESTKRELDAAISQGYNDGYSEGKSEALKIIEPSLLKIKILVDSIKKMQDKMLDEFKDGMFNIISEISGKILHKEIDEKDEYLVELFADAVKNIKTESFVTITVSGAQIDFAMRNVDLFRSQVANINDFKIVSDKNASKGTMVVETANALADASYAVQQEKINSVISQMKENLSVLESSEDMPIFPGAKSSAGDIGSINDNNVDDGGDSENYSGDDYDGYISYDNTGSDKITEELAPVP